MLGLPPSGTWSYLAVGVPLANGLSLRGDATCAVWTSSLKSVAAIATNKKRILTRESAYDNNVMGIIADTSELVPEFLHAYLVSLDLTTWASDADPPSMRKTTVENHHIPVPPLATQQVIVDELEAERELVSANRELVERMEQRIQEAIARVWEG